MFKLVVLTALLAIAAAQPSVGYSYGYGAPLAYNGGYYPYSQYAQYPQYSAYYNNYNSPLTTAYAAPLAPAVAPLPYSPVAHLIKKRSVVATAPVVAPTSYITHSYVPTSYLSSGAYYPGYPYASSYLARAAPLAPTYSYTAPLVSSAVAPVHYTTPYTHLIKKRSVAVAPVVSTPLVSAPLSPAYVAPNTFVPTTYSAAFATAPQYTNAFASPYYNNYNPYYNYASPLAYSPSYYVKK